MQRNGTHKSIAAIKCAWFLSPTDRRLGVKGVRDNPSSLSDDPPFLEGERNTFGRTKEMLYPLTRICPVYCTSIGEASALVLDERLDDGVALDVGIPKAVLKFSEDRAGKFRARAAL